MSSKLTFPLLILFVVTIVTYIPVFPQDRSLSSYEISEENSSSFQSGYVYSNSDLLPDFTEIRLQYIPSQDPFVTKIRMQPEVGEINSKILGQDGFRINNPLIYVPNSRVAKVKSIRLIEAEKDAIQLSSELDGFLLLGSAGRYYRGQLMRSLSIDDSILNAFLMKNSNKSLAALEVEIEFERFSEVKSPNDALPVVNRDQVWNWAIEASSSKYSENKNTVDRLSVSKGTAVKISINETGIYKLTADDLRAVGFEVDNAKLDRLVLLGSGGRDLPEQVEQDYINTVSRQPLIINTEGGTLKDIVFLGGQVSGFAPDKNTYRHYINTYVNTNHYVLAYATESQVPVAEKDVPSTQVVNMPTSYTHRIFHEKDILNLYDYGGGRDFLGENINQSKVFTDEVYNLIKDSEIEYLFSIAHRNKAPDGAGRGSFEITMNGEEYPVPIQLGGTSSEYHSYERRVRSHKLSASLVQGNKSSILFGYQGNSVQGNGYLDYYELAYRRSLTAINNSITLFADTDLEGVTEYSVEGFEAGKPKYIFDITDPNRPIPMRNLSSTGNRVVIKDELNKSPKIYYASCEVNKPDISLVTLEGLSSENMSGTDMIVVTHPNLMESALAFKEYRQLRSGLQIKIVNIIDIFNEFGGGNRDVMAIRNYFAYHFDQMDIPFESVLYWGHGHYDFRNINFSNENLVPTYQSNERDVQSISETDNVSTDDIYSQMVPGTNSNIIPSFASGRIPIRSDADGFKFLEKLKHYENNSASGMWRQTVLLTADDSFTDGRGISGDGSLHLTPSESLSNDYLPETIYQNKIYLAEFEHFLMGENRRGRKGAQPALINFINNEGSVMLNWTGHGHPGIWAHEGFFVVETGLPQLTNRDKLPYIVAATCDFSRFDHPTNVSGGEKFVLREEGGSIAMFAATRLVFVLSNNALAKDIFVNQTTLEDDGTYPSIGKAVMMAKYDRGAGAGDNDSKYFLFGDPSMELLLPTNGIVLEKINSEQLEENNETLELKGLQEISLEGKIVSPDGVFLEDFNGFVRVVTHDGDRDIEATDLDNVTYNFRKYGGALTRISLPVVNGRFKDSFYLPMDISYSENHGRIFLYGEESDGNRTAKGNFNNFIINGIDRSGGIGDVDGPEIAIYMDHPDFESCDVVAPTTVLHVDLTDSSGINATGVGIGHKLEAWLGTGTEKIDLSANYDTSLEDSKKGSTYAVLEDLEPGEYTVTVRAWDIFNNFSVASTCFNVLEAADNMSLSDTYPYPNPFSEQSTLRLRHTLTPPFDVKVNISDVSGRVVDSFVSTISSSFYGEIEWKPLEKGLSMSTGSYFYTIETLGVEIMNPSDDNIVYGKIVYVKQ